MGKSADEMQANEFASGDKLRTRANASRRQKEFDDYNKDNPDDTRSMSKSVNRNIDIARDLEYKAKNTNFLGKERGKNFSIGGKDLGFNLMDTSVIGITASAIRSANLNHQASKLRGGGNAVFDKEGGFRGVVHSGPLGKDSKVYSGQGGYSPIGRSKGSIFNKDGTYTSEEVIPQDNGDGGAENGNATPEKTSLKIKNSTSKESSLSTASRRGLLSQGGGAARRNLL